MGKTVDYFGPQFVHLINGDLNAYLKAVITPESRKCWNKRDKSSACLCKSPKTLQQELATVLVVGSREDEGIHTVTKSLFDKWPGDNNDQL
ncbi:hypothetical protein Y1Q_0017579 [Alligator mississippiensis]|uniref:Uncharacterized protein n=1 Tax=Alligator mississippiensis TaxID=8496 RepID=A0A151P2J4_ALLMI|nr:hypothetical protein Y1Q_0017579 [Alligator mississippiensis]